MKNNNLKNKISFLFHVSRFKFHVSGFRFKGLVLLFSILVFISVLPCAKAGETFFSAASQEIPIGEPFEADFFLNTEDENINAMEGKVMFPADLLELQEIRDGNSIISLWVERPANKRAGEISFSGIIPGGYQGSKGFIFSMIFKAKQEGQGVIDIKESRVLRNDGLGTETSLAIADFPFVISKTVLVSPPPVIPIVDNDPPELFTPYVSRDPNMFDNKYFLVFATQDKGLGIDHYEILEFRNWKLEFRKMLRRIFKFIPNSKFQILGSYRNVESPYVLNDQELKSLIYVKAVDKAGNERVATMPPQHPLRWYENYLVWGIIVVVIFFGIVILSLRRLLTKSKQKREA